MAYVNPVDATSPKGRVEVQSIVYDKGNTERSWSIAKLTWDNKPAVGIRWNGDQDKPGRGTPQVMGNPTWFIVPDEIAELLVTAAAALETKNHDALLAGYMEMAADKEREAEALAWSEALIGDGLEAW